MNRLMLLLALCLLPLWTAGAATIYKCRQAGGVTSYQDAPCPGRQIGVIRTAPAPAPASAPAAASGTLTSTRSAAGSRTPRTPRPSFKCTRPDGSIYFTGVDQPRRSLIDLPPAGAPRWLADAPAAPPGKIWAQDQCASATRNDSCEYYRLQIAANEVQKAGAKGLELSKLSREGQRLKAIRNHRCD